MKKIITFLTTVVILTSCASMGSKTLYKNDNAENIPTKTITILTPKFENFDHENIEEFSNEYTRILESFFKSENIVSTVNKEVKVDFNSPNFDNLESLSNDYIILGFLRHKIVLGQKGDIVVEYKIFNKNIKEMILHTKYDTTVGKTYVGYIPPYHKLVANAIEDGMIQIKKELNK